VASNVRHDPQAKALGEWLRSRLIDVPESLLAALQRDTPQAAPQGGQG
jgi:hypothetical protein